MKKFLQIAFAAVVSLASGMGNAAPITFTFQALNSSIDIGGQLKDNVDFSVTFHADTDDVQPGSDASVSVLYGLTGDVQVSDGSNFTISALSIFTNRAVQAVGFAQGRDLFDIFGTGLSSYTLQTSIGPITADPAALSQFRDISTSAGLLSVFTVQQGIFASVLDEEVSVPEPGSIALFAFGLLALSVIGRKRS